MLRASVCSMATLAILVIGLAKADDAKTQQADNQGKHHHIHATVTKVNGQKDTITVKMMDKNGKEREKTFQLPKGITYLDNNGKAAKLDDFRPGDDVLITENAGAVTELQMDTRATITRVDAKTGTVTVKMRDPNGKDVTKTFHLTEDAEYADSTGRVATLDVFQAGDQVLLVESQGKLKALKKASPKNTRR